MRILKFTSIYLIDGPLDNTDNEREYSVPLPENEASTSPHIIIESRVKVSTFVIVNDMSISLTFVVCR